MIRVLFGAVLIAGFLLPAQRTSDPVLSEDEVEIYRVLVAKYKPDKNRILLDEKRHALRKDVTPFGVCKKSSEWDWKPHGKTSSWTADEARRVGLQLHPKNLKHEAVGLLDDPSHDDLNMSAVLFDKNKKFAVVDYYYYCGNLCALGALAIFEKDSKSWKLLEDCPYVMS